MSSSVNYRRSVVAETPSGEPETATAAPWLSIVVEKVRGLHYGTVQITVHDSRVVQIERIERTRVETGRLG